MLRTALRLHATAVSSRAIGILLAAAAAAGPIAVAAPYYATTGNYADIGYDRYNRKPTYTSYVPEMVRYGIRPSRLVLVDSPDSDVPGLPHGYQITAAMVKDVLADADRYTGRRKIILDLTNLFFKPQTYSSPMPCGSASAADTTWRYELRPDYLWRMDDFVRRAGSQLTADDFEFISVHPEVLCIPDEEIDRAAYAVKHFIPNVQVAAGYAIPVDYGPADWQGHSVNHNGPFPASLDRIIANAYGVHDPANDADPLNASPNFGAYYADFRSKLRAWQTIDWVTDATHLNCRHDTQCPPDGGSAPMPMHWVMGIAQAESEVNWCKWLRKDPRINGQIAFTYAPVSDAVFYSMSEMPEIVRATHANVSQGICEMPQRVLAADTFTTPLSVVDLRRTSTAVGRRPWFTDGSPAIGGGALANGMVLVPPYSNPVAVVAVGPGEAVSRRVTVTGDINANGAEWAALGFSRGAGNWLVDGQIWVWIRNSGYVDVRLGNGTSLQGGERLSPAVLPFRFNRVELTWDPAARTVAVRINGFDVMTPTALPPGFTPSLNYVGFGGKNAMQGTAFDTFEFRTDP